jgi:hypothetical protein
MSPKLRGENIARPTGPSQPRMSVGAGDVHIECPRDDCTWSTVRPEHAAWSAREAHRINHQKGMVP